MTVLSGTPPFPLQDPVYISVTLAFAVIFFGVFTQNKFYFIRPRISNWLYAIMVPIIIAPAADIMLGGKYGGEPLIASLFANPVWEEFLFRATFIGFLGFVIIKSFNFKNEKGIYAALLIFSSLSSALWHTTGIFTKEFLIIALNGFLYGALYIWNDKNILPPIIAHAAGNLFLLLL